MEPLSIVDSSHIIAQIPIVGLAGLCEGILLSFIGFCARSLWAVLRQFAEEGGDK